MSVVPANAAIRADFPILDQLVNGQPLVYLDNAATAQKPRCVIDALVRYYERDNSNVHRGIHELSNRATTAFEAARARAAQFINARSAEEIIFTRGTTEGINLIAQAWGSKNIKAGDRILLTGTMGDHQVAVLIARKNLAIEAPVLSDVAPLGGLLLPLLPRFADKVRFMRDPTRGGVGVTLNEMAAAANARFVLDESRLPVRESVRGVCEILGFDPLYLANEGKAVLVVAGEAAEAIVAALREHPYGREAAIVGEVREGGSGVRMRTLAGGVRAVDYPVGDQLPRIC